MGQNISYIITPSEAKVPLGIVHFKENGGTVIPLLMEEYDAEKIVDRSEHVETALEFYEDVARHFMTDYATREVFEWLDQGKLTTFGFVSHREIMDLPESRETLLFIDNKRMHLESKYEGTLVHEALGIDFTFGELIRNEEKYWSYETAKHYYFTQFEGRLK